jgi:hypothetical protein
MKNIEKMENKMGGVERDNNLFKMTVSGYMEHYIYYFGSKSKL